MSNSTTSIPVVRHEPVQPGEDNCITIIQREHVAVSAVLQSILLMLKHGPGNNPERFFDVLRAMLFYIDEFPERLHHPKESNLLFPKVARLAPELMPTIQRLEHDHMEGEIGVRSLQHALLAWEILGDGLREPFEEATRKYVDFYREHMRLEETVILPAARKLLGPRDWETLNQAFADNGDLLAGSAAADPRYDRLFTKIVTNAPAPIGVGKDWE
jgi:hemerythrin-like domain-containing protein